VYVKVFLGIDIHENLFDAVNIKYLKDFDKDACTGNYGAAAAKH